MYLWTIVHSSWVDITNINFRAAIRPKAAEEEVLDVPEDEVAGLLHLEGEGVAAEPGNDVEETFAEVEEVLDRKQGRTQHLAKHYKSWQYQDSRFIISNSWNLIPHIVLHISRLPDIVQKIFVLQMELRIPPFKWIMSQCPCLLGFCPAKFFSSFF